ncbi:hypothetical protein MferCBS31731_001454 [Microsporum ferrugineum]
MKILTCRTRKLKCDEQKPQCSQCRKAGRECRLSEAVVFRHQQNASMNQDEGGIAPNSLKGFYSYKNTFGADSVWLDIPKEVVFVDNSDPYADDLGEQYVADTPLGTHETSTWGHEGGFQTSPMDAQTHGLDALSAAATAENHPIYHSTVDHIAENSSSHARLGNTEHHPQPDPSNSSPNNAKTPTAVPPGSPSLPLSSPNNNINFILNPLSNVISQPIDPDIQFPGNRRVCSGTSASLASQGLTQETRVTRIETEHETAFLLRHFSEGPGQWMDLFDIGKYFGAYVPVKALTNPLLKCAACACAAKQLARVNGTKAIVGGVCKKQARMEQWPDANRVDWYYFGTKYYEKSIQLLMEELQHDEQLPALSVSEAYRHWQAGELGDSLGNTNKGRKLSSAGGLLSGAYSDEVLAATAILSVYEFLDATGPAWERHLCGIKSLLDITKAGMIFPEIQDLPESAAAPATKRPRFSEARKAIFWNFARQDYLSAFINEGQTRLNSSDLALWTEAGILLDNPGCVQQSNTTEPRYQNNNIMREDMISNSLIWILSKIVDFIAMGDDINPGESSPTGISQHTLLDRWHQLQAELDGWYKRLPDTFTPCARIESSQPAPNQNPTDSQDAFPFPEIWYSIPMCASTMQHYHMACILLLINKPHKPTARRSTVTDGLNFYRSIESDIQNHSREICGISMARPEASVRVHSVQPLFISGQCLTSAPERRTILEILCGIEEDLGWATKYRVQQLLKEWEWDEAAVDSLPGS